MRLHDIGLPLWTSLALVFALTTGGPFPWFLFYCLAGALVLSGLWAYHASRNVDCSATVDRAAATAGEVVELRLELEIPVTRPPGLGGQRGGTAGGRRRNRNGRRRGRGPAGHLPGAGPAGHLHRPPPHPAGSPAPVPPWPPRRGSPGSPAHLPHPPGGPRRAGADGLPATGPRDGAAHPAAATRRPPADAHPGVAGPFEPERRAALPAGGQPQAHPLEAVGAVRRPLREGVRPPRHHRHRRVHRPGP